MAEQVVAELESKNGKKINILTNEQITNEFDLLVNATPVGMYPNTEYSPLSAQQVDLFRYVYDIVYNPSNTQLLKLAKEKGKIYGGGLSMLVCQAEQAQTHWYGAEFTKEETALVIEKSAKQLEETFKE